MMDYVELGGCQTNHFLAFGEIKNRLRRTYKIVRNQLHLASDRIKTRYDIRANSPGFSTGDHVWLYNPACKKGRCPKLQQDWDGPYVILKPRNDVVYRIQKPGHGLDEDIQP